MKYLAIKKKRSIFLVLKALGLKPIMIEKVRFVSCIVAKFLSFINNWKFTAMIVLHFDPQPQFKYELMLFSYILYIMVSVKRRLQTADQG